jgi:hypothetical protein
MMTTYCLLRLKNIKKQKMTNLTTVEDFLRDDDFIRYTLDCETDRCGRWAQYLNASAQIRAAFLRATDILLHLDECSALTPKQVQCLKQRIEYSLKLAK